jgi:hypothetical protein
MNDFHIKKSEPFMKQYPRTKGTDEFDLRKMKEKWGWEGNDVEFESIRRMVGFLYDPRSEAAKLDNYEKAIQLARKQAKVPDDIEFDDQMIYEMGCRFMILQGSYRFMQLINLRAMMHKTSIAANAEVDEDQGDDRLARYLETMGKAMIRFDEWAKRAKELEKELFGWHLDDEEAEDTHMSKMAGHSEIRAKEDLF